MPVVTIMANFGWKQKCCKHLDASATSCPSLTVDFADHSFQLNTRIVSWLWDFGDDTEPSTTPRGASHEYLKAGKYTVTLTIKDDLGNSSRKMRVNAVKCIDAPPRARFDHRVPNETYECHLNNTSRAHDDGSVENVTWLWTLGDGSCSTDYEHVHTYPSVGKYTVVLTATDRCGRTSCSTGEVFIRGRTPSPKAFLNWAAPASATSQLQGHMPTFVL